MAIKEKVIKKRTGIVVSDKMDKTIVVACTIMKQDKLYKKRIKKTFKVKAHDEKNEAGKGDTVVIQECRPMSKDKKFRLIQIIKKAVEE